MRQGFTAECQDCPTMIGEDYGELIRNGVSTWGVTEDHELAVRLWAVSHEVREKHTVRVSRYATMELHTVTLDNDVWKAFLGG